MKIDRREILRYLGYRGKQADETVLGEIELVLVELRKVATPKSVTLPIPIVAIDEHHTQLGQLVVESRNLASHLNSCKTGWLFAATLGAGVDRLIQRYHVVQMSRAAIAQAVAAAMIEAYCDQVQASLQAEATALGQYLRPRYSPGYGDFLLTYQAPLLQMLDATKRIGLTCTATNLLTPLKSVTAVIGMTEDSTTCHINNCMNCQAKNCPFRKDDTYES